MNPKVSIIISTYNRQKFLRQAIGSILAQTFEDWEIALVDDNDEDKSLQTTLDGIGRPIYAEDGEAISNDHRIEYVRTDLPSHRFDKSPGISSDSLNRYCHNINRAFKRSKGDYITYLCDDDLYIPYRLEFMAGFLDAEPKVMMVYGEQQLLYEDEQGRSQLSNQDRWSGKLVTDGCGRIDHSSVMHRRECFEKAGGWDESAPARYGDMYFWKRLHEAGYVFHGIPEVLDIHRFSPDSTTTKAEKFEAERKELQIK